MAYAARFVGEEDYQVGDLVRIHSIHIAEDQGYIIDISYDPLVHTKFYYMGPHPNAHPTMRINHADMGEIMLVEPKKKKRRATTSRKQAFARLCLAQQK